jgi:hypothetical protein
MLLGWLSIEACEAVGISPMVLASSIICTSRLFSKLGIDAGSIEKGVCQLDRTAACIAPEAASANKDAREITV